MATVYCSLGGGVWSVGFLVYLVMNLSFVQLEDEQNQFNDVISIASYTNYFIVAINRLLLIVRQHGL